MALYPVFVHDKSPRERNVAVSGEIPDFPGCYVAADSWEHFPSAVQEAAQVYFEGEDLEIPAPTPLDRLSHRDEFQQGQWVLVDIDHAQLNTTKERINLSIPSFALREIDAYAARIGENRSRFLYSTALKLIRGQLHPSGAADLSATKRAPSKVPPPNKKASRKARPRASTSGRR